MTALATTWPEAPDIGTITWFRELIWTLYEAYDNGSSNIGSDDGIVDWPEWGCGLLDARHEDGSSLRETRWKYVRGRLIGFGLPDAVATSTLDCIDDMHHVAYSPRRLGERIESEADRLSKDLQGCLRNLRGNRVIVLGKPRSIPGGDVVMITWAQDNPNMCLSDGTVHPAHRRGFEWEEPVANLRRWT